MNIYDTKVVSCVKCGKAMGEIDYDAVVILPKCGKCANPMPDGIDKLIKTTNEFKYDSREKPILVYQ